MSSTPQTLTEKALSKHLTAGDLEPGEEVGVRLSSLIRWSK